ncbi:MAG: OmpH family outer membrane protein [Silicimonas sp.]|nr:OmpH family outer membrane protein [Silicimonas sp.]
MKKTPSPSRSRRNSKIAVWCLAAFAFVAPVFAQTTTIDLQSPILVIDQDRLFSETRLGTASLEEIESAANALKDENQRIEEELIGEERSLTQQRATLPAAEFRDLADAFDVRVQRIRAEQDEKARALTRTQEEARAIFFQDVADIISEIVREKGAVVVLDRRDVFLSAGRIDITDEAIARVNAADRRANE